MIGEDHNKTTNNDINMYRITNCVMNRELSFFNAKIEVHVTVVAISKNCHVFFTLVSNSMQILD